MEVVPVSLSDPWSSVVLDETTKLILGFVPIIAFFALLLAAIWRQAKKYPVKAIGDSGKAATRNF
tara:strand:+ start:200 stop:394 length:195 start_codon:yes stop_codon:yes gene_type:complete